MHLHSRPRHAVKGSHMILVRMAHNDEVVVVECSADAVRHQRRIDRRDRVAAAEDNYVGVGELAVVCPQHDRDTAELGPRNVCRPGGCLKVCRHQEAMAPPSTGIIAPVR